MRISRHVRSTTRRESRRESSVPVDVLANDSDPDGDDLRLVSVGTPETGTARIEGGRVRYTAPAGAHGVVAFVYTAADSVGRDRPSHRARDGGPRSSANGEPPPSSPPKPAPDAPPVPDPAAAGGSPPCAPPPAPPPPPPPSSVAQHGAVVHGRPRQGGARGCGRDHGGRMGYWHQRRDRPQMPGRPCRSRASNSNSALFTSGGQPAVAADGTLTFTPALGRERDRCRHRHRGGRRRYRGRRRGYERAADVHDRGHPGQRRALLHRGCQPRRGRGRRAAVHRRMGDGDRRRSRRTSRVRA